MYPVAEVDVPAARRAKHHGVAGRDPFGAVAGQVVGPEIGLRLAHHLPSDRPPLSPHRELAVGALVCRRKQAATLRKLLPRAW